MDELVEIKKRWKHWHFKNTALLIISLIVFFFLADTPQVKNILQSLGNFGYIGVFIAGILFVSAFTVAPAIVILFHMAKTLDPYLISLVAGAGGVVGDFLIFKFLKNRVFDELEPLFIKGEGKSLKRLFHTPYFAWMVPLIGAILIASPFPDELGISLMGLSKFKDWQFITVIFILDTLAVFLLVTAARNF